tara:strand:- start:1938 stop:2591 length:654 start_codon:yes stop_codon:yes gene_type:complete
MMIKMKLNDRVAELIGAIIGDGCIRYSPKISQYFVEIVGDPKKEKRYFVYLVAIFNEELNLKVSVKVRERGLRLRTYSKSFVEFLIYDLRMPYNNKKCQNVTIPTAIIMEPSFLKSCLRGIMDTDGSLFMANKGYRNDYPTIEISTTSVNLAHQMHSVLSKTFRLGFRNFKQGDYHRIYRISLNGDVMVKRWFDEIGFSNFRNLDKYLKYKNGAAGI